jgi:hypothetical protein
MEYGVVLDEGVAQLKKQLRRTVRDDRRREKAKNRSLE